MSLPAPGRAVLRETLWEPRFFDGWSNLLYLCLGFLMVWVFGQSLARVESIVLTLGGGFVIASSVFGLWSFFSTRLELDAEGFAFSRCGRSWRRSWSQCESIGFARGRKMHYLTIAYRSVVPSMALLRNRPTRQDTIDVSFGMGAQKLADLMDRYRTHTEFAHGRR